VDLVGRDGAVRQRQLDRLQGINRPTGKYDSYEQ
jgi:hypothetical protein